MHGTQRSYSFSFFLGFQAILWNKVGLIVLSWFTSPLGGAIVAAIVFQIIRFTILRRRNPLRGENITLVFVCVCLYVCGSMHAYVIIHFLNLPRWWLRYYYLQKKFTKRWLYSNGHVCVSMSMRLWVHAHVCVHLSVHECIYCELVHVSVCMCMYVWRSVQFFSSHALSFHWHCWQRRK